EYHSTRLGLMKWKDYVNAFGLGHRLGVDLPSEDSGNIPDTTAYDKEYNRSWNSCTMVTMGIGQDKMLVTPLQMANAMCIVANKGYYYTPHFVRSIDDAQGDDSILNKYHVKHEPVTHISDDVFNVVQSGMQDVIEIGTGRVARIPGITMCGKTGTAENKQRIDGRVLKLHNHSWFVCFAPKENPKIAVAVIVENGGYGSAQAAPIGSFIVEKYLNDTLRNERLADVNRITGTNLMPKYLVRLQFRTDSLRAAEYASQTGDSTRLLKYLDRANRALMLDTSDGSRSPLLAAIRKMPNLKPLTPRVAPAAPAAPAQKPDSGRHVPALDTSASPPIRHKARPDTVQKPSDQKGDSTQP
ncbi:MAG TPA: penicillin-binding transpeptidase domain-containing protein, partial [Puia sp.]